MGKIKNVPFRVFCYVLVIVFLFLYLFPLFYVVNTSIKSSKDYMLHPSSLTSTWKFDNFVTAWNKADFSYSIFPSKPKQGSSAQPSVDVHRQYFRARSSPSGV